MWISKHPKATSAMHWPEIFDLSTFPVFRHCETFDGRHDFRILFWPSKETGIFVFFISRKPVEFREIQPDFETVTGTHGLRLATKAMRFGKAFELRYNFAKLYRETDNRKRNSSVHFRHLSKCQKCVDCRKYRLFWYNIRDFQPFLEPFRPFLKPFWPLLEPFYTGMYRKMSKFSKIAVYFWRIPSNVENLENNRRFSTDTVDFRKFQYIFPKFCTGKPG